MVHVIRDHRPVTTGPSREIDLAFATAVSSRPSSTSRPRTASVQGRGPCCFGTHHSTQIDIWLRRDGAVGCHNSKKIAMLKRRPVAKSDKYILRGKHRTLPFWREREQGNGGSASNQTCWFSELRPPHCETVVCPTIEAAHGLGPNNWGVTSGCASRGVFRDSLRCSNHEAQAPGENRRVCRACARERRWRTQLCFQSDAGEIRRPKR